jgi:hypothetical protein
MNRKSLQKYSCPWIQPKHHLAKTSCDTKENNFKQCNPTEYPSFNGVTSSTVNNNRKYQSHQEKGLEGTPTASLRTGNMMNINIRIMIQNKKCRDNHHCHEN